MNNRQKPVKTQNAVLPQLLSVLKYTEPAANISQRLVFNLSHISLIVYKKAWINHALFNFQGKSISWADNLVPP